MNTALPYRYLLCAACVVATLAFGSCGDDEGENAGQGCDAPDQCYANVDPATLAGAVQCLDRVPEGYCTHRCASDTDCCNVSGECKTGIHEVCAPFESTGMNMCFLSCEAADVGDKNPDDYCKENANSNFICRSTGGGSTNRKVCAL